MSMYEIGPEKSDNNGMEKKRKKKNLAWKKKHVLI